MATLLEVRGLSRHFGGLRALQDVDLAVDEGEILGLIGPNGAGKTTLFNCISGVLKPTAGEVLFRGQAIHRRPPHELVRLGLCHTHQIPRPFIEMTILENVLVGARFGRGRRDRAEVRAADALAHTGLSHLANALASQLTAGQRKLLEIARVLATDPDLVLLDEVCGGLNPAETAQTLDVIRSLPGQGMTVIYIEHNMRAVMSVCNRIAVLDFGHKIAEGTPQEIVANQDVIAAYLGTPITKASFIPSPAAAGEG